MVTIVIETAACITGFTYLKKWKGSFMKAFPFYLLVIVILEVYGNYLIKDNHVNEAYYTWFVMPLEFGFFIWLYYMYFKQTRFKIFPIAGGILYAAACILSLALVKYVDNYWQLPISYMIGIIVLLGLSIIFFVHLFNGDNILYFRSNIFFWVSIGLLVFYLISSPFYVFRESLYKNYKEIFWLYYYIQFFANYLMYILFSIGFIWGKPQ